MDSFHDVSLIILHAEGTLFLERCIRSCVAQTFPGRSFELVILYQKPSDIISSVVESYCQRHEVKCVQVGGECDAMVRMGLRKSTGRFVVFLDSGDFLSDYMILMQAVYLYDNHQDDAVAVDHWLVAPDSDRKVERRSVVEYPLFEGVMVRKDVLTREIAIDSTLAIESTTALYRTLFVEKKRRIGRLPVSFYRRRTIESSASHCP